MSGNESADLPITFRADHVNAYTAGDGGIVIALRVDQDWRHIWLSAEAADQLAGMLYLLTK